MNRTGVRRYPRCSLIREVQTGIQSHNQRARNMTTSIRPRSMNIERTSVQVIGEETLVYDEIHHQAWCLNRSSACIWRLCDGHRTVQRIATAAAVELNAPVTTEIVLLTLAELRGKNLLEPETVTILPEVSRREMIGKAGLAAAALLPVVASILAPPAHAQSGSLNGMARTANTTAKG